VSRISKTLENTSNKKKKETMIDHKEFRNLLEENKKVVLKRIRYSKLESKEEINKPTTSDRAWMYENQQRKTLLLTRTENRLYEIEAAIKHLDNGAFGKCKKCGKSIHLDRLKVMPTTDYVLNANKFKRKNNNYT
jgi:RNA polymerase-binding protein DksA